MKSLKNLNFEKIQNVGIRVDFNVPIDKNFKITDKTRLDRAKDTINFIKNKQDNHSFTLTYWMNNLQKLQTNKDYFVTINPKEIPKKIHDKTIFKHPKFTVQTSVFQSKIKDLQGVNNTFLCGAYHGFGFHEDGIQSAAYLSLIHI